MMSKILFVFTVVSFLNPIAVMADQMKTHDYKAGQAKCEEWKAKMLAQQADGKQPASLAPFKEGFVGSLTTKP